MTPLGGPRDATVWEAYERSETVPCSHVVVSAVADVMDCSPLDLEPLYRHVDPDALDDLVDRSVTASSPSGTAGPERPISVRFDFAGCEVVATASAVNVAPLDPSEE